LLVDIESCVHGTGCIEGNGGHSSNIERRRPNISRGTHQLLSQSGPYPQSIQLQGWLKSKWCACFSINFFLLCNMSIWHLENQCLPYCRLVLLRV
jgi:hypothetical protein